MEVLYHIRPFFVGIFPHIGLIYGRYLQFRRPAKLLSIAVHPREFARKWSKNHRLPGATVRDTGGAGHGTSGEKTYEISYITFMIWFLLKLSLVISVIMDNHISYCCDGL